MREKRRDLKPKFQSKSFAKPDTVPDEEKLLELKNPHSVRAVLKHRPSDVKEIFFHTEPQGHWIRIAETAYHHKIPVRIIEQKEQKTLKKKIPDKQERIGHAYAIVQPRKPDSLETVLAGLTSETPETAPDPAAPPRRRLWLALDSLQDPHNVGAIFRTAAFFGLQGIIVTKNSSSPINSTVYDIAAGGVESIPFAVETNLNRALKTARRAGLWVLGTSEHAERSVWQVDRDRPWLMVVGNEQKGLRRLVLENCDDLCTIPQLGEVSSLNVSVATGVVLSILSSGASQR